jgi:hypothetical protein
MKKMQVINPNQLFDTLQIECALFQRIKMKSSQLFKSIEENSISKEEIQLKIQEIFHLSDAGHNLPLGLRLAFFNSSQFHSEYLDQEIIEAKKVLKI